MNLIMTSRITTIIIIVVLISCVLCKLVLSLYDNVYNVSSICISSEFRDVAFEGVVFDNDIFSLFLYLDFT